MLRALISTVVMGGALAACTSERAEKMLGEEFPQEGMYETTSSEETREARRHLDVTNKAKLRQFVQDYINGFELRGDCRGVEVTVGGGAIEAQGTCTQWDYPTQLSGSYGPTSLELIVTIDMEEAGVHDFEKRYRLIEATSPS